MIQILEKVIEGMQRQVDKKGKAHNIRIFSKIKEAPPKNNNPTEDK